MCVSKIYVCIFMEKQWEDFYLGWFFKRVETTASQKAKSTEQARVCDDVFLHVHYVYVCLIRHVHGAVFFIWESESIRSSFLAPSKVIILKPLLRPLGLSKALFLGGWVGGWHRGLYP